LTYASAFLDCGQVYYLLILGMKAQQVSENSLADKINQPEKKGIQTMLVVEKLRLAILFKVPLTPLLYCNFIITIK